MSRYEARFKSKEKEGKMCSYDHQRRLKNSKLTKNTQAMIIQAIVESTMTFNYETKAWHKKEIRSMERIVDQGYRYVWVNTKGGPVLMQVEEKRVNLWAVRRNFGVTSMQAKIEERVMRRISHILRMENNHPTKRITLGWYVPLLATTPQRRPRRGTLGYWRKVPNEAGLDPDAIEPLVCDGSEWREIVRDRKRYLEDW